MSYDNEAEQLPAPQSSKQIDLIPNIHAYKHQQEDFGELSLETINNHTSPEEDDDMPKDIL